ncbi:fibronectin type III domain protein [Pedobacter duraquae]|uniref:Fibronectin type III domain protein n=2 Tax=Pedobacter duraquae TaxID=425511 RepID=A0A4V3C3S1_9SPHI|nr:fibronectin type III domain protein [Pedobacter duraquae]
MTNYAFNASISTYSALSAPAVAGTLTGDLNNGAYNALPIGFDFWYMGSRYTTISAATNGFLVLGNDVVPDNNYQLLNNLATGQRPMLAPFWDDMVLDNAGLVSYQTSGTAPNRIFTVQYSSIRTSAGVNVFPMQIRLSETSGTIQFFYNRPNAATTNVSASIGINSNSATSAGSFLSLNNSGTAPTVSSATETTTITPNPGNNQSYSFTPSAVAAATDLFFTDVTSTSITLNWTDNSADDAGFAIYRSTDNTTFSYVGKTSASATTFNATGLAAGTTYYFRTYSIRESLNAAPLTGTQATVSTATSGLVLYYPFNGNSNEVISGARNAVSVAAPALTLDRFGAANSAYYFSGSNYMYQGGTAYPAPTAFSLNLWFKTNTATGGKLIGFGGNQTGSNATFDKHIYMSDAGKLYFGVYDNAIKIINTASSYNDNVWHNVVATLSSTGMKLYVDGVLQAASAATTAAQGIQGYWRFGYDALTNWKGNNTNSLEGLSGTSTPVGIITSDYFTGTLDDIQISNRELTSDEIKVGTAAAFNGYAYKKTITLNTKNIVSGTATLTNFPYLLSIQDNDLKLNTALCNLTTTGYATGKVLSNIGADITFTSSTGTALNFDIDTYDPTTGTLVVWLKLPSISNASNLLVNMLFGKATPDVNVTSSTWPSDYKAVFHFDENTYTGTTNDATTSALTAAVSSTMSSANFVSTGKIGKAFTFNGTDQKIVAAANTAYALASTPFTLSAWINTAAPASDQKIISNQTSGGIGYKMGLNGAKPENQNDGTPNRDGLANVTGTSQTVLANTWYHVQGVYSGTTTQTLTMYVNGEEKQKRTGIAAPGTGTVLSFGVGEGGNQFWFNGTLDEIRISNLNKSADWIRTEYRNQNNPTTSGGTSASIAAIGALQAEGKAASSYPGLVYTFAGTYGNDPFSAANWTTNTQNLIELPAATGKVSVIIPASKSVLLSNPLSVYGLSIASGSTLDLNAKMLSVGCNVYNSGIITGNAGSLTFNGISNTQDYNSTTTKTTLVNLTGNNTAGGTVNLNTGVLDVTGVLSLTNNTKLNILSPVILTLKSTATTISNVAALTGTSAIAGNVSVETWLTGGAGKRGTRMFSSAINETSLLTSGNSTYQQLQKNIVVTGPGGAANGFDPGNTAQPFAVVLTKYNEPALLSAAQFINIPSLKTGAVPLAPAGEGFLFFFRGDRTNYTTAGAANSIKLSANYVPESFPAVFTGPLNQGNVSVTIRNTNNNNDANNGYNVLGNPYAATIDWDLVVAGNPGTGIANELRVIQPGGAMMSRKKVGTTVSVVNTGDALAAQYIQPGQGFYTRKTTAGTSAFTFSENYKAVTSVPNRLLSIPDGQETIKLRTLSAVNPGSANSTDDAIQLHIQLKDAALVTDETAIVFKAGMDPNFDENDAAYFAAGGTVTLSTLSLDGKSNAINFIPEISQVKTVKLNVNATTTGNMTLNFSDITTIGRYKAKLRDAYSNTETDIKSSPVYTFSIDRTISATYGAERFTLVLEEPDPQSINLSSFVVKKNGNTADLNWISYLEQATNRFEVERSSDGMRYTNLSSIPASQNSNTKRSYSFTDLSPLSGLNYYRIKTVFEDESSVYSEIRSLNYSKNEGSLIRIYPNPSSDVISINLEALKARLTIFDLSGKPVKTVLYGSDEPIKTSVNNLKEGVYIAEVKDSQTGKVVFKSLFVKR